MKCYKARVGRFVREYGVVTVIAESKMKAAKLAHEKAQKGEADWCHGRECWPGHVDEVEEVCDVHYGEKSDDG